MNTYTVHISESADPKIGPFAVFVVFDPDDDEAKTVAGKLRIASRDAAESVARDYRAQFGVAS